MIKTDTEPLAWRTSRRSQSNNACVEVAFAGDLVFVRDSKHRSGPVITFDRDQFATFLTSGRRSGPVPVTASSSTRRS